MVAAAWAGMAVPTAERTEENVAEVRDREPAVYLECNERTITGTRTLTKRSGAPTKRFATKTKTKNGYVKIDSIH